MAGNTLLQRMQAITHMGMGVYVNEQYSNDLATLTDLLERAAGIMERENSLIPSRAMTRWLADYRAAKGE